MSTYRGIREIGAVYLHSQLEPTSQLFCHGRYTERGRGPSPGWADFTIMMECTPESGHCLSVNPVAQTAEILVIYPKDTVHGSHM